MEFCVKLLSLPLWERGLKSLSRHAEPVVKFVAPLVGAWIEICSVLVMILNFPVAPLVGAWIEMYPKLWT